MEKGRIRNRKMSRVRWEREKRCLIVRYEKKDFVS